MSKVSVVAGVEGEVKLVDVQGSAAALPSLQNFMLSVWTRHGFRFRGNDGLLA
jgi:hypothetical protein